MGNKMCSKMQGIAVAQFRDFFLHNW